MPLKAYGEEWREQRKVAHIALNQSAVRQYHKLQEHLALSLCDDIIQNPAEFFSAVRLLVPASISFSFLSFTLNIHQHRWPHYRLSDVWYTRRFRSRRGLLYIFLEFTRLFTWV
jgi:cytochrome P450